jgi:hypothetical protein
MRPHTSIPGPATPEQLVYLWLLAQQTGTTFRPAHTRQQVRREIQLLIELKENRENYPALSPHSEPFELGRYQTQAGEQRTLYGILADGGARIVDTSAEGPGRMYTVQEQLGDDHGDEALQQIAAAYIAQAQQLGRIPLAPRQP